MVTAEGHLAVIIKPPRASPPTALVTDRLRLAQNKTLYSNEDEQTRSVCFNTGEYHKRDYVAYPIRSYKNSGKPLFTYEQVTEIINLLQTTNLSLRAIAKQYNVNHNSIMGINNGSAKRYLRDGISYPIRKN
jgi:hypothetical protein